MANPPDDEFSRGWPAVVATFAAAVFAWGFGSYGHGVYVEELHRVHGWPTSALGAATTLCFLLSAGLLPWVGWAVGRVGERCVLLGGVVLLGAGTIGLSLTTALWQIFPYEIVMGLGWSGCGLTAISISLARRFDRKRGLALGLALNGAGVSNIIVLPTLVVQREFPTRAFGAVLGLSNAISQIAYALTLVAISSIRDVAGSYDTPFAMCIGMALLAALLIALPLPKPSNSRDFNPLGNFRLISGIPAVAKSKIGR
jgi:MFS family permease